MVFDMSQTMLAQRQLLQRADLAGFDRRAEDEEGS